MYNYPEMYFGIGDIDTMVATKENQKSTAMDYFAAPRSEGLVVGILEKIGFTAGDGGRLPAGVKYDFVKAVDNVLSADVGEQFGELIGGEVSYLQANRKTSAPRITATPKSIMELVKSGKLSLDELKTELAKLG